MFCFVLRRGLINVGSVLLKDHAMACLALLSSACIWTFSYCLTFVSRKRTLSTVYVAEQTLRHKMTIKQGYGYFFTLEVDP